MVGKQSIRKWEKMLLTSKHGPGPNERMSWESKSNSSWHQGQCLINNRYSGDFSEKRRERGRGKKRLGEEEGKEEKKDWLCCAKPPMILGLGWLPFSTWPKHSSKALVSLYGNHLYLLVHLCLQSVTLSQRSVSFLYPREVRLDASNSALSSAPHLMPHLGPLPQAICLESEAEY